MTKNCLKRFFLDPLTGKLSVWNILLNLNKNFLVLCLHVKNSYKKLKKIIKKGYKDLNIKDLSFKKCI